MREASTNLVYEFVKNDARVMALTADGRNGVYERIRAEFPAQYMDYGIAEANMVSSAAGLAAGGMIPFLFGTTNFIAMRAFEFIRNDVAIPNYNVKFLGIFSGLSRGGWGATHQGTEEVALLRCLPNLVVITPATPIEAREATRFAYEHDGSVYIRLEASGEPEYLPEDYTFAVGKGQEIRAGHDVTLITMGAILDAAIQAAEEAKQRGLSVRVLNMPTLKPIDADLIKAAAKETKGILTMEEHAVEGGLGSTVAEVLAEAGIATRFCRLGLHGCAKGCGNREAMREINGLASENIMEKVWEILQR